MTVVFEGADYPAATLLAALPAAYVQEQQPSGAARATVLGYLGPAEGRAAVIILPKAFLNAQGLAFGAFAPAALLGLAHDAPLRDQLRQGGQLDFIFRAAVWLHQAIGRYQQRHPRNSIVEASGLATVTGGAGPGRSALEIVQSLLRFHQENPALFTWVRRLGSSQQRAVSWPRTVARQQPVLQGGRPVYAQPVVKQPHLRYDEELLNIFASTLLDLQQEYGFRLLLNPLLAPLPAAELRQFRRGATRRLKQIRGNYFSDQLVQLWQLLYLYYEQVEAQKARQTRPERLLVRDFDWVFEDMVDALLSDPPSTRQPPALTKQRDGKLVDHLYEYAALLGAPADRIFYLADSKYYQTGARVSTESIYKQYTYARNVIQENIRRLNKHRLPDHLRYRDPLTEGYNPTPNFFISAYVPADLRDVGHSHLTRTHSYQPSYHFRGRLFDRDTLLLQRYDINFLFVLAAYVRGRQQPTFRTQARTLFRRELLTELRSRYGFYRLTPPAGNLEDFVTRHFRLLHGRVYQPTDFMATGSLLLAVEKTDTEVLTQLASLQAEAAWESWEPA
ncbi:hypothetical protein GCM10027422_09630 [Hymenobacter arcticus]